MYIKSYFKNAVARSLDPPPTLSCDAWIKKKIFSHF